MDILQAIEERHSVRQYADKAIEQEKRQALCDELKKNQHGERFEYSDFV